MMVNERRDSFGKNADKAASLRLFRETSDRKRIAAFLFLVAILAIFSSCKKENIEGLSKTRTVAVAFYIDDSFKLDLDEMSGFSIYYEDLYSVLCSQDADILAWTFGHGSNRVIELSLLRTTYETPYVILSDPKRNADDNLLLRFPEFEFRIASKRINMAPRIAKETSVDAVLWIHAQYGGSRNKDRKIAFKEGGLIIELVVTWSIDLIDRDGRLIWRDKFVRKNAKGTNYFGTWASSQSGTTVTESMILDSIFVARTNGDIVSLLTKDLVSTLSEKIVLARSKIAAQSLSSNSGR